MEFLYQRKDICENSLNETMNQIKILQSKHQQLIGYKQAIVDIISDFENDKVEDSIESINPEKISQVRRQPT